MMSRLEIMMFANAKQSREYREDKHDKRNRPERDNQQKQDNEFDECHKISPFHIVGFFEKISSCFCLQQKTVDIFSTSRETRHVWETFVYYQIFILSLFRAVVKW